MVWASGIVEHSELTRIPGERCLFSRSPSSAIGASTNVAVVAGTVLKLINLPLALALSLGSLAIDVVPKIRRFKRLTIQYYYRSQSNEWFWSPYRQGEVNGDKRWISVSSKEVPVGRFQGKQLETTNAMIVDYLAKHNPCPRSECLICLKASLECFSYGSNCYHKFCSTCSNEIDDCPFCLAPLHSKEDHQVKGECIETREAN